MKLYFAHGKESGPWGTKIQFLARRAEELGWAVESPDYSDLADPDARVERLLSRLDGEAGPVALVGSSMGGYVSLVASYRRDVAGVFLLAPALYLPGYREQRFDPPARPMAIVHGWRDDVVPPENSYRFARDAGVVLHFIDDDHRLSAKLDHIGCLLTSFLREIAPEKTTAATHTADAPPKVRESEAKLA